ncbi:hypothetical protein NIES39_A02010 [Arthrospira platensis NIES-39]|nr:hypothetical protein NIES39_A02010 [Arthrospira platensis NIES-39]
MSIRKKRGYNPDSIVPQNIIWAKIKIHDAPVGADSPTIFALHQIICWFALGDTY